MRIETRGLSCLKTLRSPNICPVGAASSLNVREAHEILKFQHASLTRKLEDAH